MKRAGSHERTLSSSDPCSQKYKLIQADNRDNYAVDAIIEGALRDLRKMIAPSFLIIPMYNKVGNSIDEPGM